MWFRMRYTVGTPCLRFSFSARRTVRLPMRPRLQFVCESFSSGAKRGISRSSVRLRVRCKRNARLQRCYNGKEGRLRPAWLGPAPYSRRGFGRFGSREFSRFPFPRPRLHRERMFQRRLPRWKVTGPLWPKTPATQHMQRTGQQKKVWAERSRSNLPSRLCSQYPIRSW